MEKQKEQDLQLYLYLSSWKESLEKKFKIWWTCDLCVPRTGQMDRTYCSVFLNLVIYLVIGSRACKSGRKWSSLTLNGRPGYESGCQFQARSHNSVFFFSCQRECNSFPTSHPLVSSFLKLIVLSVSVLGKLFPVNLVLLHYRVAGSLKLGCKLESTSEKLQFWLWQENHVLCISFVLNSMIAFSRPVSKIWIYIAYRNTKYLHFVFSSL